MVRRFRHFTCGLLASEHVAVHLGRGARDFSIKTRKGFAASLYRLAFTAQIVSVSQITCNGPLNMSRNTHIGDSYCTDSKCVVIKTMYTSLIYVLQEKQMPLVLV